MNALDLLESIQFVDKLKEAHSATRHLFSDEDWAAWLTSGEELLELAEKEHPKGARWRKADAVLALIEKKDQTKAFVFAAVYYEIFETPEPTKKQGASE